MLRSLRSRTRALGILILSFVLTTVQITSASGQDCADHSSYLHWQATQDAFGGVKSVTAHEGVIYYGHSSGFVEVTVPSSTGELEIIATLTDSLTVVSDMVGSGNVLYVGNEGDRLVTFDVSSPWAPAFLGFMDLDNQVVEIAIAGNVAYVSVYARGVAVLDVTDPAIPVVMDTLYPNHTAWAIEVAGERLYATTNDGLEIFDITTQGAPSFRGSVPLVGTRGSIAVAGSVAYVADGAAGLQVVDVSDPALPVVVDTITDPRDARDVVIDGDRCFVADFEGSGDRYVWVLDITTPLSPVVLGDQRTGGQSYSMAVDDGRLFVVAGDLEIFEGIHLPMLSAVAEMDEWKASENVTVVGETAYLSDYYDGLRTVDVTDPANPVELGVTPTVGNPWDVDVQGPYAYVAARSGGLSVVDVSNPAAPVEVGDFDTAGSAMDVQVAGNFAFVADDDNGLVILDVSEPTQPGLVSTTNLSGSARSVVPQGDLVFVGCWYSGLHVLDVSVPAIPVSVANIGFSGGPLDMALEGDHLYMITTARDLKVFDVSTPSSPAIVGTVAVRAGEGIQVQDGFAYIADAAHGVVVADVSDPSAPFIEGNVDVSGRPEGLAITGDHVFVATPAKTMAVTVVNCPTGTDVEPTPTVHSVRFASLRPNPFNPRVVIEFVTSERGPVELDIYDVVGRHVRNLVSSTLEAGTYAPVWDGNDATGRAVGSGVYFVRVQSNGDATSAKVTLLR